MDCNCGRQIKYSHFKDGVEKGSCNKHIICPTYLELQRDLHKSNLALSRYKYTVNKIDDYFECSMESKKDQKKVHQLLCNLTDSLKT